MNSAPATWISYISISIVQRNSKNKPPLTLTNIIFPSNRLYSAHSYFFFCRKLNKSEQTHVQAGTNFFSSFFFWHQKDTLQTAGWTQIGITFANANAHTHTHSQNDRLKVIRILTHVKSNASGRLGPLCPFSASSHRFDERLLHSNPCELLE